MRRNKLKYLSIGLVALTPIGLCLPKISNAINNKNNIVLNNTLSRKTDNSYYMYDNRYFNSMYDVTKYAINKYQPVDSDLYIGNTKEAIFDLETGRLNINELRKYDKSKIKPAYKNALGDYTWNYDQAKKSFINPGLIQYKYDDLNGNLFDSREEAKESMLQKTNSTPIMYNEIQLDEGTIRINPFNKDDINEFKWLALKKAIYRNDGFSFDIYGKDSLPNSGGEFTYSNSINRLFNFEYSLYELIDSLVHIYFSMKNDFLLENSKWNVTVKLNGSSDASDYKVQSFSFNKSNYKGTSKDINVWNEDKKIHFSNISFKDLESLNAFLKRGNFTNNFDISVSKWAANYIAENAITKSNILGANFKINYTGSDKGGSRGTDIKILEMGTDGRSEVKFDLFYSLVNEKDLKNKIDNALSFESLMNYNDELSKYKDNLFVSSLLSWAWDIINKNLSINTIDDIKSFNRRKKDDLKVFNKSNNKYKNINWKDSTLICNDSINKSYFINNNHNISNNNFINLNSTFGIEKIFIDKFDINNFLKHNKNNFIFTINYNNHPLFQLNNNLVDKIFDFDFKLYGLSNNKINLKNKNEEYILNILDEYNRKIDKLTQSEKKEIANNLTNVSQSILQEVNQDKKILKLKARENINNKKFISKFKLNDDYTLSYINGNKIEYPSLSGEEKTSYPEEYAIGCYNKVINNITNKYNTLSEKSKEYLVDPNEILCLYNETGYQIPYHYGEYLTGNYKFNESMINSNRKVYYDEYQINEAKKNNAITEPAKVVILYDLLGNIINPGVKLTESEELLTSNDAIYDSESTILDNLMRTKIIRPDTKKVFYEDGNSKYTLLDNQSNLIYSLDWENRKYYFATYEDLWNFFEDTLRLDVVKVVK